MNLFIIQHGCVKTKLTLDYDCQDLCILILLIFLPCHVAQVILGDWNCYCPWLGLWHFPGTSTTNTSNTPTLPFTNVSLCLLTEDFGSAEGTVFFSWLISRGAERSDVIQQNKTRPQKKKLRALLLPKRLPRPVCCYIIHLPINIYIYIFFSVSIFTYMHTSTIQTQRTFRQNNI